MKQPPQHPLKLEYFFFFGGGGGGGGWGSIMLVLRTLRDREGAVYNPSLEFSSDVSGIGHDGKG